MAAYSVPPSEVLLSKRVQEMVLHGEEPLGPYICRSGEDVDGKEDIMDTSPIPIIDLNLLSSSTTSDNEREQELEKLRSALSSWGCFQGIGHGIKTSFLDKIRQVSREFFKQPMEEKNKYAKSVDDFQGYGADPVPEQGQSLDWSDRLFLEVFPEDRREYNLWPQIPISFSYGKVTETGRKLLLGTIGKQAQFHARFNYYLPCQRPDLVLGLKPHADGTGYTIILQDEVGLQVLKDGKWYTVPKDPTALFVLMGDQMEVMSNGIFKGLVHMVVSNSERDRISVAMFYTPELGKEIGPEDDLVNMDRPRIYKKVTDYAETHWKFYQRGLRALHTAHI
ncbi:protein SRG1-like [Solanum tuberosum]|uniref:protein SRG1-like n=1 Tax=Solanum tuberosum TaxID=4113 RepID=UPI00073A31F7|nr:PREDICTED: protein SRG1-like [Solanum tuberosum]